MKYSKIVLNTAVILLCSYFSTNSIFAQSVMVYPMGGEKVLANTDYNINWKTDELSSLVRIELLNVSKGTSTILVDNFSGNNFVYRFPFDLADFNLRLRISDLNNTEKQLLSDSYFNIVKMEDNPNLSAVENTIENNCIIYPNPSNDGAFSISWTKNNIEKIQILDELGNVVLFQNLSNVQATVGRINSASSATYFVQLLFKDGSKEVRKLDIIK